ncbi:MULTISPECIES: APC family permease [unclassified Campylobacter]|uniref:APC family permease n=1 Tax=unclassified Campylobacter TaxID=2593542 RepID=UPI00301508F3
MLLIVVALMFYLTNHKITTPYNSGYLITLDLNTLVFSSTMMFAFAGLELSTMIGAKIDNAQKNYPKAIFFSAFIIVGIYILGTFCVNVIYPAKDTDILDGIMQAITYAENNLGFKGLSQLMAFSLFVGTLGQINSWLVAPIYMLANASKEGIIKFYEAKPHPKYNTPYKALFFQAFLVSIICIFCVFFNKSQDIYWLLSSLTTVSYFLPYIAMFLAYFKLKNYCENELEFKIQNQILSYFLAILGLSSVVFALILSFITPNEEEQSELIYFLQIMSSPILALIIAIFSFNKTRNK